MDGTVLAMGVRGVGLRVQVLAAAGDGPRWGRAAALIGVLLAVLVVRTVILHLMGHEDPGHGGETERPGGRR